MRKSRFSEAQIIRMIKEQEAGMPTADGRQATTGPETGAWVSNAYARGAAAR